MFGLLIVKIIDKTFILIMKEKMTSFTFHIVNLPNFVISASL